MAWYYLILLCAFGDSVRDLGAESFDQRMTAEARLTHWAHLTWPLLDGQHQDLEVRLRSRRVLAYAGVGCYRPIATLSGKPLLEWVGPEGGVSYGPCLDPRWQLAWLRPDQRAPLALLIYHYGERARTQHAWIDWHSIHDSQVATQLLERDLTILGLPPPLVHWWLTERP